jgi:DNA-directed RNA polymerase subunit beta'
LPYKDGERVKSVHGLELLKTQLMLEIDTEALQLAADIEFVPDEVDPNCLRLQLVILESLSVRQDIVADPTQGSTVTRILVEEGDRIAPGAVVARTEIICKQNGEIRGIRQGSELVRRVLVVTDADCVTVPCRSPNVKAGDLLRAGDGIGAGATVDDSGQVVSVESDSISLRIGRPYLVSPGAVLQTPI